MLKNEICLEGEIFKKFRLVEVCNLFWCVLGKKRKYCFIGWRELLVCKRVKMGRVIEYGRMISLDLNKFSMRCGCLVLKFGF